MSNRFATNGAFSWTELMTTDPDGAVSFYADLFGWEIEDYPNPEGGVYKVIRVNGEEMGGIMEMPPEAAGQPPAWGSYVTVPDVDAVAAKAEQAGGKIIVPPRDIPEVGRFCVIMDPQGAFIAAITYLEKAGS